MGAGWQVGVHGCGDDMIHAYLVHPEQFETIRQLNIGIAAQPVFIYSLGDSFYENMGEEKAFWASPHKAGKFADMVVDRDFLTGPFDDIRYPSSNDHARWKSCLPTLEDQQFWRQLVLLPFNSKKRGGVSA